MELKKDFENVFDFTRWWNIKNTQRISIPFNKTTSHDVIIHLLFLTCKISKKGISFHKSQKIFFLFLWEMKALMPMSQNPWSDFFHLLNTWH